MIIETAVFNNPELNVVRVNENIFIPYPGNTPQNIALDAWIAEEGKDNEIGAYLTPEYPRTVSKLDFLDLLGIETLVAIETAAETSPTIRVMVKYLDTANSIDLGGQRVAALLAVLVKVGIMTQEKLDEVLA